LTRQRPNGGWGYNCKIPADADSTSFAIRAALEDKMECGDLGAACEFLLGHRDENIGGFKTYSSESELQKMDREVGREGRSFAGWCSPHLEVTASVLESLSMATSAERTEVRSAVSFLERSQDKNGLWKGYWATDAYYPTYRTVVALRRVRPSPSFFGFEHTIRTLTAEQHKDGSWRPCSSTGGCPIRTALAAETLLLVDPKEQRMGAATQWLLDEQRQDGSWASIRPFLRIPPPHVLSPDEYQDWGSDGKGHGAMYIDTKSVLTTSTVVSYLAKHLQELNRGESKIGDKRAA
jgi:squalene-hopene/tetraprenyl-beta-curcumene cyclase